MSGITKRGQLLTATTGAWTNNPTRFNYQWLRCAGTDCQPIPGAMLETYRVAKPDQGHGLAVLVTATNAVGSGTARSTITGAAIAGPPVNTRIPVIASSSPLIQQGVTLTMTSYAWDATDDTGYSFSWERCDGNGCVAIPGATGDKYTLLAADVGKKIVAVSTAGNVDGTVAARSAETDIVAIAGPRWKTLPLLSNSNGRVGDVLAITPGVWTGPTLTSDTVELMRCTNVCVRTGATNLSSYTVANGDLGAILRVKETAANAGGSTVVWSARYVGPIVGTQGASAVLSNREAPLRSASGETLALARLSGGASAAAAKPKSGPKVALRRPSGVKGKLTAWACPAAVEAGATPPPCSKKVKLVKKATLSLPATTTARSAWSSSAPASGRYLAPPRSPTSRPSARARPSNPRRTTLGRGGERGREVVRAGRVGDEPHVLDEDVEGALGLVEGAVDHPLAPVVEHERGGGAVADHVTDGAGVEPHGLGEGERLGGRGDVHAAQQLVDELDLLAVAGLVADDRRAAGQRVEQRAHALDRRRWRR